MTESPQYCPYEWLALAAAAAEQPEAFARRVGDAWLLIGPDAEDDAETAFRQPLEPGQIIRFSLITPHDDFVLVVHEDGSHSAGLPGFPAGRQRFRLPEWEWGDSVEDLDELVRLGAGGDVLGGNQAPLAPGIYTVECYTWQNNIPLRFAPEGDTPRFVASAGAN